MSGTGLLWRQGRGWREAAENRPISLSVKLWARGRKVGDAGGVRVMLGRCGVLQQGHDPRLEHVGTCCLGHRWVQHRLECSLPAWLNTCSQCKRPHSERPQCLASEHAVEAASHVSPFLLLALLLLSGQHVGCALCVAPNAVPCTPDACSRQAQRSSHQLGRACAARPDWDCRPASSAHRGLLGSTLGGHGALHITEDGGGPRGGGGC